MGWDVKLTRSDGMPLGSVDSVKRAIADILPKTRFCIEPCGCDQIAEREASGSELPEALRAILAKMPALIRGDYGTERDNVFMQFNLGAGGNVTLLHVMIKGDNDAAEALLTRLATTSGWSLSNYSPRDGEVNLQVP